MFKTHVMRTGAARRGERSENRNDDHLLANEIRAEPRGSKMEHDKDKRKPRFT